MRTRGLHAVITAKPGLWISLRRVFSRPLDLTNTAVIVCMLFLQTAAVYAEENRRCQ